MQFRQFFERVAQAGQVARSRTAQRDARGDTLHVHAGFELLVHLVMQFAKLVYRIQPRPQNIAVAQRMVQPVIQQAAAHVGGAGVEQRHQGGRRFTAQGLGNFQIAPRRGIHAHVVIRAVYLHAANVRDGLSLRELGVTEQRTGGFQPDSKIIATETC